jgi:hypothetical protein
MTTEAEFLDQQAERAKARLRRHIELLGEDLLAPVDVRTFVRRRPFWSIGGAAIGGAISGVVAKLLLRRKQKTGSATRQAASGANGTSWARALRQRAGRFARTALSSFLVAQLRARTASSPPCDNGPAGSGEGADAASAAATAHAGDQA